MSVDTDFKKFSLKNDLKIVVENTNANNSDILVIENNEEDFQDEDYDDNLASLSNDKAQTGSSNLSELKSSQNDNNGVEIVESGEIDDTEFHVNLDKVPLSLKNTILVCERKRERETCLMNIIQQFCVLYLRDLKST